MIFTILIPYRPSQGGMNSPRGEIFQDENCIWRNSNGVIFSSPDSYGEEDINRTIKALKKNSIYKHRLIIAIDSDMHYHVNWLKKLGDNVEIFQSRYIASDDCYNIPKSRQANTMKEGILSLNDNEIVIYAYISDLVCGKYWDKHIEDAYKRFGDDCIYVPMFIEPRTIHRVNTAIIGPRVKDLIDQMGDLTASNIWVKWREMCCHALTLKPPVDREYLIESDLDEWSIVCNSYGYDVIIENCGDRKYGYWAPLISRNKRFKDNAEKLSIGANYDLIFEQSLGKKIVVTKSHIFHMHLKCILDNVEVEHVT